MTTEQEKQVLADIDEELLKTMLEQFRADEIKSPLKPTKGGPSKCQQKHSSQQRSLTAVPVQHDYLALTFQLTSVFPGATQSQAFRDFVGRLSAQEADDIQEARITGGEMDLDEAEEVNASDHPAPTGDIHGKLESLSDDALAAFYREHVKKNKLGTDRTASSRTAASNKGKAPVAKAGRSKVRWLDLIQYWQTNRLTSLSGRPAWSRATRRTTERNLRRSLLVERLAVMSKLPWGQPMHIRPHAQRTCALLST